MFGTHSAWPLASGLVAYNATLLLGFLNFVAAIGIALLLAAGWIAWRERHPRRTVALAAVGTVALFFCHLMGLVFFFVLIAGHELEQLRLRRTHRAAIAGTARRPAAAVRVRSASTCVAARAAGRQNRILSPADKARQLVFPFANYILPLDIATAVRGRHIPARLRRKAALPRLAGQRRGAVADGAALSGRPWAFKGTYFLDTRFVIMLGFLLFGAVLPSRSAALGRTFRRHRLHAAVRHPHGGRRARLARASA